MKIETIYVDDIVVGDRLRTLKETAVVAMMESIKAVGGIRTPIAVRWEKDDEGTDLPILVAGYHRVEACKRLDIDKIDSIIVQDEREARLWEIAENLHRSELTVQERADHIAEWIELTKDKQHRAQQESGAGVSPQNGAKVVAGRPEGGERAAIRELGITKGEAHRAGKISALTPEIRRAADEAGLNSLKARLEIAQAPDKLAKVADLKRQAEERKTIHKTGDDIVTRDAADDAAQMIVDFLPEMRLNEIVGYLDAAGATRVTKSIRRILKTGDRVGSDRPVFGQTYSGAA